MVTKSETLHRRADGLLGELLPVAALAQICLMGSARCLALNASSGHSAMMLRRGRKRIDTGSATWTVADRSVPAAALVVRFDSRYRHDPAARSANPIRVGIAIPFNHRFGPLDRKQLDKIEDKVEDIAAGRGVMVLILTTPEMREHVLYTATGEWVPQFHQDLKRALGKYDVQMMAEEDPSWSVYTEFARTS